MTQEDKNKLYDEINALLQESYDDEAHSYELEYREMLEKIVGCWQDLTELQKVNW